MGQVRGLPEMGRNNSLTLLFSSKLYIVLLVFIGFWFGAMFSHRLLGQVGEVKNSKCPCEKSKGEIMDEVKPEFDSVHLIKKEEDDSAEENTKVKKIIYLYDSPTWKESDLWKAKDWQKCHRNDCIMSRNKLLLQKSSVVVVNSLSMGNNDGPLRNLKEKMDRNNLDSIKFAFFSGATPLDTKFDSQKFDNLFDLTITYKSNSDIRLSHWPATGILPSQLRMKNQNNPSSHGGNKMNSKLGKFDQHFFDRNGKEQFMAYIVRTCDDQFYGNRFVMKLRDEGMIHIFTTKTNCTTILPEPQLLPCKNLYDDECTKFFEKFKFVIITEEKTCEDYLPLDYWYSLTAWEASPVLFTTGDCTKMGMPGACIDALQHEYVSPTFKQAYAANNDVSTYKNYWNWKEDGLLEEYNWQCELCELLHSTKDVNDEEEKKIKFSEFWDRDKNCGKSNTRNELMRAQLARVGAISG